MKNHSSVTGWQELFFLQILLIFGSRCNRFFSDIRLNIYRLPNFNMLFQFLLTKFSKRKLFSCLQKVDLVTNYCKKAYWKAIIREI